MIKLIYTLSLVIVSVIFYPAASMATDRIRDMSLSVEETNKQLATPQTPKHVGAGENFDDKMFFEDGGSLDENGNRLPEDMSGGKYPANPNNSFPIPSTRHNAEKGFINKFCSSAYKPQTIATAAQQDCMDKQRQQACERFMHTPVPVQKLLSQAIDCEANANDPSSYGCESMDANRMDLLKQYWQDEDTAYTILFLPDLVLNSAENCSYTNKQKMVR